MGARSILRRAMCALYQRGGKTTIRSDYRPDVHIQLPNRGEAASLAIPRHPCLWDLRPVPTARKREASATNLMIKTGADGDKLESQHRGSMV